MIDFAICAVMCNCSVAASTSALLKVTRSSPIQQYEICVSPNNTRIISHRNNSVLFSSVSQEFILPEKSRPLAREAMARLRDVFGSHDYITVREVFDPDAENEYSEYFIVVNTTKAPDEAIRLLDGFIDSWWIDNIDPSERLNVTVEYPV